MYFFKYLFNISCITAVCPLGQLLKPADAVSLGFDVVIDCHTLLSPAIRVHSKRGLKSIKKKKWSTRKSSDAMAAKSKAVSKSQPKSVPKSMAGPFIRPAWDPKIARSPEKSAPCAICMRCAGVVAKCRVPVGH